MGGTAFNLRQTPSERGWGQDSVCRSARTPPCAPSSQSPLQPALMRRCLTADARRRGRRLPSIIVAASTPGPTGFTKIKSYHLLHAPHPPKQVIKGKWGVSEQMEEPLICIRCHLQGRGAVGGNSPPRPVVGKRGHGPAVTVAVREATRAGRGRRERTMPRGDTCSVLSVTCTARVQIL